MAAKKVRKTPKKPKTVVQYVTEPLRVWHVESAPGDEPSTWYAMPAAEEAWRHVLRQGVLSRATWVAELPTGTPVQVELTLGDEASAEVRPVFLRDHKNRIWVWGRHLSATDPKAQMGRYDIDLDV